MGVTQTNLDLVFILIVLCIYCRRKKVLFDKDCASLGSGSVLFNKIVCRVLRAAQLQLLPIENHDKLLSIRNCRISILCDKSICHKLLLLIDNFQKFCRTIPPKGTCHLNPHWNLSI